MKKHLFIFILFTSLFSFSQNRKAILSADANVRSAPSGVKLKILPKGKEVLVLQTKNDWSFIKDPTNNKKGWIHSSILIENIIILTKDANVRWKPKGGVIKVYPKGKTLVLLNSKASWLFVQDPINKTKGWIHKSLISKAVNTPKVVNKLPTSKNTNTALKVIKTAPKCDYIITSHSNGAKEVEINPTVIRWSAATGSPSGYYISVGATAKRNELLNNINIGNSTSYSIPKLKPNTKYYISLLPYNELGLANDCNGEFSFTTGSGFKTTQPTTTLTEKTIKNRLRKMGIQWKWKRFLKGKKKRIQISNVKNFIQTVKSYIGVRYKYSGTTRKGIDCSGLIWRGLKSNGYNGERLNGQGLAQSGQLIADKTSLKKGDLVCFSISTKSKKLINHIAIYLGNNNFLHAPSSGKVVQTESLSNRYWASKFIFGVRL